MMDLARLHGGPRREPLGWEPGPGATICTAFAAQVVRHPYRAAILADDGCVTYRELGSAVAATARAIAARVGRGEGRAALLCRHGANTVTALLAALVSGRAYVPLDPAFPTERLAQILADSGADVLIADVSMAELARSLAGDTPVVHIRPPDGGTIEEVSTGLESSAKADDPAYLLYTSGSTGVPKGVVQSHGNVLFGVANHIRNFAITPDDRTSVLTSFGYDMAVTDTLSAILSGAAAVPADIKSTGLAHLTRTLATHGVTIYHSTPTVYRYLLASLGASGRLPEIRAVLLGGEEVTRHDVELARKHFSPQAVFVNGYGTTEISFATQFHLPPEAPLDFAVVPIGHPLPGIEVVIEEDGQVVVRCPHVALGYWGLPELTASRFVDSDGVRAYRTGDIARRLPDGALSFSGRADRMVKIRGYRVELGEVEAHLAALPGVVHAAVVARVAGHGSGLQDKEIIAYVVSAADTAPIRAQLAAVLPEFMLPRAVIKVDALPIGPTGKLDINALPSPPVASGEQARDSVERAIAGVWSEVLGLETVDRNTNFFELGGHSLLMALVQERLETVLGQRLSLALLFEHGTVAALAVFLQGDKPSVASPAMTRAADRMRQRRQARRTESVVESIA